MVLWREKNKTKMAHSSLFWFMVVTASETLSSSWLFFSFSCCGERGVFFVS